MNEAKTDPALEKLPQWNCHKKVRAAKITALRPGGIDPANNRGTILTFDGYEIQVSAHFMIKHKPEAGGYFVVYADGYQSFSPAAAFEAGYTPEAAETPDKTAKVAGR
jgi:hypothetical protein